MKVVIIRQFDKVGDNFLDMEEMVADVKNSYGSITIEFGDQMFVIPREVFIGISTNSEEKVFVV